MSRRGWVLFSAMSVIWGVPYLMIKVAVDDFSPVQLVFLRTSIGALLLLPVVLHRGVLRGLLRWRRPLLVFAVCEVAVPWLLLSDAERRLSSSLTALLVSTVPFFGALLAHVSGDEPLTGRRVGGLVVGIVGVGALLGLDVGQVDLLSVAEVGVVAFGYAFAPWVASRHLSEAPTLGVVFVALTVTATVYAVPALLTLPSSSPSTKGVLSVLGLSVVCTAVAFLVFFRLIAEVGPARATVITFVNPAVAVLLGVLVLSERLTGGAIAGFILILTGCVLATRRARAPDVPADPARRGFEKAPVG